MINKIYLAIIQAVTEFLPISSSGHLALFSNLYSKPNLFLFTILHLASLFAVIIFTRKELKKLLRFDKEHKKLWIYLTIASIPALIFGFFLKDIIQKSLSSPLLIGIAFIFTGLILLLTKFTNPYSKLNKRKSFIIGLSQILALFPGISRSGITISSALFLGIDREESAKFSFLLFIPLSLGAFMSEAHFEFLFNTSIIIPFFICFILSLIFLNILFHIIKRGKFWVLSLYCFTIGLLSILTYFH